MYVKPKSRQIRGVYVPENYNGTTFTEPPAESMLAEQDAQNLQELPDTAERAIASERTPEQGPAGLPEAIPAATPPEKPPALFAGLGGLRSDDLLLLGLILLLSRSEGDGKQAAEILPMLALLLFLG